MTLTDSTSPAVAPRVPWKVLVVDDERALHDVTRLVLRRLTLGDRPVELISAFSAEEARAIVADTPDIAVALIDVVMENDQAGLDLVRDIRERFDRQLTRIILRTGHPGLAPEREVIQHFEIDDYRDKTELTSDRLFTSVYAALRAYRTLKMLDQTADGLEHILRASDDRSDTLEAREFVELVLSDLKRLARSTDDLVLVSDSVATRADAGGATVVAGFGAFEEWSSKNLAEVADGAIAERLSGALSRRVFEIDDDGVLLSLPEWSGERLALWIPTSRPLEAHAIRLVSLFIERAYMRFDNRRLEEEIQEAQRLALTKLCEAVDLRSNETGKHIYRIAVYSRRIAELAGLPREDVELIEAASPLHDVGKVAVPDSILLKPARLTDDEMSTMRRHAEIGSQLLSGARSRMLQLAEEIARTHHERWDGTGYPNGLKGEEIPIAGRIVSIADVFDALMSERCYKRAMSFDESLAEIERGVGTAFDPSLARSFLDHAEEFRSIFDRHRDE